MKIAFALAVHSPLDDRVWHMEAQALLDCNHEVFIVSATSKPVARENFFCFERNMPHSQQINNFSHYLSMINPDIVICDNPISVLGASRYKRKFKKRQLKIYYDITEWYPSRTHFHHASKIKNVLKFPMLCGISFLASFLVSGFIFGEYYKAMPYKLFFWKKHTYLTYYADLEQIKIYPINKNSQKVVLFFAGKLTETSGFNSVLQVAGQCAKRFPNIDFLLRIISTDMDCAETQVYDKNLTAEFSPMLPFEVFCEEFGKADIFFDLRKINWENSRCLPIKLFYYMAAGRPVIYSNLKAIRKGVPEIDECGFLVSPKDISSIVDIVSNYLSDRKLYINHSQRAQQLCEEKYNWQNIKNIFVKFII
ncbi:MAG: glycosyltransferase [Paludibacter sp.]|nr:glycosyltransferase [Paludibacter sp.]